MLALAVTVDSKAAKAVRTRYFFILLLLHVYFSLLVMVLNYAPSFDDAFPRKTRIELNAGFFEIFVLSCKMIHSSVMVSAMGNPSLIPRECGEWGDLIVGLHGKCRGKRRIGGGQTSIHGGNSRRGGISAAGGLLVKLAVLR